MQDKDFDRFIQQSLESFPEPEYNPAHWDKLEDRLHNLNAAQPQPSAGTGFAGSSLAKLGFVASAVLVTALNVAIFTKPEIFQNGIDSASKTEIATAQVSVTEPATKAVNSVSAPEIAAGNLAKTPSVNGAAQIESNSVTIVENSESTSDKVVETPLNNQKTETVAANSAPVKTAPLATIRKNKASNKAAASLVPGEPGRQSSTSLAWPSAAAGRPGTTTGGFVAGKPQATVTDNCTGNSSPFVSLALAGNDTVQDNRIAISTCQNLVARFFTADKDSDKLTVTSNIASVLPGATLYSDKADQPGLMLQFEAKPEMARQQPYEFTLWISDNSCPNAAPRAVKYALSITPAFTVAIKGNTNLEKGDATTLVAVGAPAGSTYEWRAGKEVASTKQSALLHPAKTTTYYLMVNSPAGCQLTDSVKVMVAEPNTLAAKPEIPNIFTPNNDGINDFFAVNLPEAGAIRLEVFDRWGKKVYENDNYTSNWNAQGLAAGTYYYILTTQATKKAYKGWVEVNR